MIWEATHTHILDTGSYHVCGTGLELTTVLLLRPQSVGTPCLARETSWYEHHKLDLTPPSVTLLLGEVSAVLLVAGWCMCAWDLTPRCTESILLGGLSTFIWKSKLGCQEGIHNDSLLWKLCVCVWGGVSLKTPWPAGEARRKSASAHLSHLWFKLWHQVVCFRHI